MKIKESGNEYIGKSYLSFYGWRVINGGYYVKFDDYCVILSNFIWYDVFDFLM